MPLLYRPLFSKDSPELARILDYLALSSGGALSNPVVKDAIVFAGPEGSYEDIQIEFNAPTNLPPSALGPSRETFFSSSIDLLVQYPNVVLNEISSIKEPFQWYIQATPLAPFAPVLRQLAIVAPPATPSPTSGNLWLGPKQTNLALPDALGDRRYSAPTDTAVVGTTTAFNGFVWQKTSFQNPFSGGLRTWWQAVASTGGSN